MYQLLTQCSVSRRRAIFLVICAVFFLFYFLPGSERIKIQLKTESVPVSYSTYEPILPAISPSSKKGQDPTRWLRENSGDKHAVSNPYIPQLPIISSYGRPRAALISLVRNSELEGIMQSMRQLEYRWNRKYQVRKLYWGSGRTRADG